MDGALIIVIILLYLIIIGGAITVAVLYMLTLSRALKKCKPENQLMPPANVWLTFIPLFGIGWIFVVIIKVSGSLKLEYESRGIAENHDFSKGLGIAYASCNAAGIIPIIGWLAAIAGLVMWIVYWVKIKEYSSKLDTIKTGSDDILDL